MKEQKVISFKTSFNSGDIIYALSSIKAMCERMDYKASLYIWLDRAVGYYNGAVHPYKDLTGRKNVSQNHYSYKMLKPLLESQEYIYSVDTWNGEEAIDLDLVRTQQIGQPYGDLRRWIGLVFPDMHCDISLPALELHEHKIQFNEGVDTKYIVVNRTERYLNPTISYFFLKDYPVVLFVGLPKEYNIFKKECPHAVHVQPTDFLELAHLINHAQLFIGNQSMCFSIAEQLKCVRVLEVCREAPNVITSGENGYDFVNQKAVEYLVSKLWKGDIL